MVVLDVSKSMSFGSRGVTKLDYGRYLAACLSYLSTKQRDRVGIVTFDDDIVERVPPSAKHFDVTLHTLDKMNPGRPGALGPPLYKATEFFKRRSILAIISDFYEEPTKVLDAIKPLRFAGNDVIMFHVLDPAEVDFPYDDSISFQDLETERRVPVVPDKLRDQYRALIQEHIQSISQLCSQNRIDYAFLNTKVPLDHALFKYLAMRHKLTKIR